MERAGPEVDDAQHIHNKALFDAVNQALKLLLPPHGPQLTTAQRRVRREQWGSHRWQAAVKEAAAKQVCGWAAPRAEDDLDALLLEDILKVRPSGNYHHHHSLLRVVFLKAYWQTTTCLALGWASLAVEEFLLCAAAKKGAGPYHTQHPWQIRLCLQDELEWADTTAFETQLLEEATNEIWSDLLSDALVAMKALPKA